MEPTVTIVGIVCVCIVAVVAIVFGRQMGAKAGGASLSIGSNDTPLACQRRRDILAAERSPTHGDR
jgi:hypothetical protein